MTLLFITQKLHGQDAFGALWIDAFVRRGYDVHVICLEWRPEEMHKALGDRHLAPFTVHSLCKEQGRRRMGQVLTFWRLISTLRYDRVFIHMSPVWGLLGAWRWMTGRPPVYLWYTHYKMQAGLKLLGWYGKRLFCATPQSLPQYQGSERKVVVGHGIDLLYWPRRENRCENPQKLLMVHRLSRSKRVELSLSALTQLPKDFTLDIYGIEAEAEYVTELRKIVKDLNLASRVTFHGTLPMQQLADLYTRHRFILNMASETIDKTMLEAMTCGCYPVTTRANARAIGIPEAPAEDTHQAIAAFIQEHLQKIPLSPEEMYAVVREKHSLDALIEKMDRFIQPGI